MDSRYIKKSLKIRDRDVYFSIEQHFWICLEEIARGRATTAARLAASIALTQTDGSLSAAIRAYVLDYFRKKLQEPKNTGPGPDRPTMPASDIDVFCHQPRWLN